MFTAALLCALLTFGDEPNKKSPDGEKKPEKNSEKKEIKSYKATEFDALLSAEGKEVKVTGTVASVYKPKSGKVVVLNFGKSPKCFQVAIFKDNFDKFGGVDEIVKLYEKKEVTATGAIKKYRDAPEIIVDEKEQLTVAKKE